MHLKLRDSAVGVDPNRGNRRSLDRIARMEELKSLVCNYENLPLKEYIGFVVGFHNNDI